MHTTRDQEIKTEHNPRNQSWNNTQDIPAAQAAETTDIPPAQTRKIENAKTRADQDTKEPHPQAHHTTKQEERGLDPKKDIEAEEETSPWIMKQ